MAVQPAPAASIPATGTRRFVTIVLLAALLLAAGLILSVLVGAKKTVTAMTVFDAFFHFSGAPDELIVRSLRLPRAVVAAVVGANLAVAGVLMQGITRNSLASPGLFGVNAGASVLVVGAMALLPTAGQGLLTVLAFAGAAAGGILVYVMGTLGHGKMEPVKLALAGVTVTALMTALTQGVLVLNEGTTAQVVYWLTGAVDGRIWTHVWTVLPWSVIGLIGAMALARPLDVLMLGDEIAVGLGQNTDRIRTLAGIWVVVLAGSAVAVAGPIGFIGLIVPHIGRRFSCLSHTRLIPLSALLGGLLLVYADVLSRFVAFPYETPVGILTGVVGAPFFLYLARREKGGA